MNSFTPSNPRRTRGGFSLVEIIIVLAIIAVLMGSAIYFMGGAVGGAKLTAVEGDISNITALLKLYELNSRFLPTTEQGLKALMEKPTSEPVPRRWTKLADKMFTDPWQRPYVYVYPGKRNPKGFDLYSLGEDGVESEDDLGNW
ncbi:MAG: type II secretion system major pseudopilin GspG [Blastochloris sp.]|nr:type II secretion system major pseudopilin GspG [Blastochloris sp.]